MANPSAEGGATAAGTEVLRRKWGSGGAATTITPGTDTIITVISVIWCSEDASSQTISLKLQGDNTTEVTMLKDQTLPSSGTFTWTDRFVMAGADVLTADSSNNADILISYIEQGF